MLEMQNKEIENMKCPKDAENILKRLEVVRKKDMQGELYYCWNLLPKDIQQSFIQFCLHYTQRSYEDCIDGWEAGWHKECVHYLDWLKGEYHNPITEREARKER